MDIEDVVYDFSVRLVELVRYFKEDGGGFPLCDKLLDCGVRAGISARAGSHEEAADYVRQADYILEMAVKSGYLTERQGLPLQQMDCAGSCPLSAGYVLSQKLDSEGTGQRESTGTGLDTAH